MTILNERQQDAVRAEQNVVVTAGAGSGKTTVLAVRYAYLILKRNIPVEQILTLTFTNKATNEMYERIYKTLAELSGEGGESAAQKALDNFYEANIQTLDSFCSKLARSGAAFFGIAPDWTPGEKTLNDLINNTALSFVIDRLSNTALNTMAGDKKINLLSKGLFAGIILNESSISSPLNFKAMFNEQKQMILDDYPALVDSINEHQASKKRKRVIMPEAADIKIIFEADAARAGAIAGTRAAAEIQKKKLINYYNALREAGPKTLAESFAPLVNFVLQLDVLRGLYRLLDVFQKKCNTQKRKSGLLSFNDAARLALDTLKKIPEIRRVYQDEIKAIMVDEFQDNNSLQKELLFLIAGDEQKLFFVGDEKQSIYRFRGADVSVFRELSETLPSIRLETNYRSRNELILAFNILFEDVFNTGAPTQNYDAEFYPLNAGRKIPDENNFNKIPCMSFALIDSDDIPKDEADFCRPTELQAAHIAKKIDGLVRGENSIFKFEDIAVLMRRKTHQIDIENALKNLDIHYNTENPGSFFDEPFVRDAVSFMRLLIYPHDKLSYAVLLRSPFARLSDEALTIILLTLKSKDRSDGIFDEAVFEFLDEEDTKRFKRLKANYYMMLKNVEQNEFSLCDIIQTLWENLGYRVETLAASPQSDNAANSSFDYLFELAVRACADNKTLAQFLHELDEKKIEDVHIPVERGAGVHILTIHKSKGLEFPVVFIFDIGAPERALRNSGYYFSSANAHGSNTPLITLNIPQAAELPGPKPKNYFYEKFKDEEKRKAAAELRRLVYVAATRAKEQLHWTGAIPKRDKSESESTNYNNEDSPIISRIKLYRDKILDKEIPSSILDLIAPPLAAGDAQNGVLWKIEAIKPATREFFYSRGGARGGGRGGALFNEKRILEARRFYETASLEETPQNEARTHTASTREISGSMNSSDLKSVEFGSFVHSLIEARFRGETWLSEEGETKKLVDGFFESELGQRAAKAKFVKTEFPFIALVKDSKREDVYINGRIDLLFCDEAGYCVVDYKTDKIFDPRRYEEQLLIYRDAVRNIFGADAEAYLFYLRLNKAYKAA